MFQAKLLSGGGNVRRLTIPLNDAQRLQGQAADMLKQTDESVAVFYTQKQIYVVDAAGYESRSMINARRPLAEEHRLITLGTYLGRWLPRCTKGDQDRDLNRRLEHQGGFRNGISMEVVSQQPTIAWGKDPDEEGWRSAG